MRRVMVMGPPGTGKSTLARRLGAKYHLPVFHLDQAFHRPGWVPAKADDFRAEVERIAGLAAWVIDGNYTDTMACRSRAANTIIYLDMPVWILMPRILRRTVTGYGQVRLDGPLGCPERFDAEFLRFVWRWNRKRRARMLAMVDGFAGRKIVLRGRRELRWFLREEGAGA